MERLTMLVITVALSLAAADQSSCSTTFENSAHTCGYMSNGSSCGFCDVGRCCSRFGFCQRPADILSSCCGQNGGGQGTYSCNARCSTITHEEGGVVNATLNGYLDGSRRYVTDGGDVNTTSFSCVDSFDSDRKQYPSAAFLFVSSASNCGRCLKTTNVGIVGGVRREVTVRIVHERISSHLGIELDSNGFKQLDIDGNRKLKGQLMVKYEFLSC